MLSFIFILLCAAALSVLGQQIPDVFGDDGGETTTTIKAKKQKWNLVGEMIEGTEDMDFGRTAAISVDGKTIAMNGGASDGVDCEAKEFISVQRYSYKRRHWKKKGINTPSGDSIYIDVNVQNEETMFSSLFGASIALSGDGDTVAGSALYSEDTTDSIGYVRVFAYERSSNSWERKGCDIDGTKMNENVALSKDGSIVAGSTFDNDLETDRDTEMGSVNALQYNSVTSEWIPLGQTILGQDSVGSVDLSDDGMTMATSNNTVQVYVYNADELEWEQLGQTINGTKAPLTKAKLAADGRTMVVATDACASWNPNGVGLVRVYEYNPATKLWERKGRNLRKKQKCKFSGDFFAHSLDISRDGSLVAVGAPADENGGSVSVYKFKPKLPRWKLSFKIYGNEAYPAGDVGEAFWFGSSLALTDDPKSTKKKWLVVGSSRLEDSFDDWPGYMQVFKVK